MSDRDLKELYEEEKECDFCTRGLPYERNFFMGPHGAYICADCIETCHGTIKELEQDIEEIPKFSFLKPRQLKKRLDDYVIGQDNAKIALSVAVYNHYKRIYLNMNNVEKSNIMILGPTGVGKSYLAENLARILKLPFYSTDVTSITEAGYVGDDVESIIKGLILAADGDIEKAQTGMVYLDEIDKIKKGQTSDKDVSGEGAQHALLKIIGSKMINVQPSYKNPDAKPISFNLRNVLFISGGAFPGLDEIISQTERADCSRSGFTADIKSKIKTLETYVTKPRPEHLIQFGIIPEFVGRFPVRVVLNDLSENDLTRILTEPKDAIIAQYQTLFEAEGKTLKFTQPSLKAIAQEASKVKSGARGLRSVLEDVLIPIMFDIPDRDNFNTCTIHKGCITKGEPPRFTTEDRSKKRRIYKIRPS